MAVVRQVVYNGFIIKFVSINKFNMMMMFLSMLQQKRNTLQEEQQTRSIGWDEFEHEKKTKNQA